jgi:hypothetical protein
MISRASVRDWLFRGLLADNRLDELESEGVAIRAQSDPGAVQRLVPMHDFPRNVREGAIRALEAYLILYLFENSVRDLVAERLSENHGPDWWETNSTQTMRTTVAGRQKKEDANRWHMQRGAHPIFYTDFDDLSKLFVNNWADFADLLPDQQWLTARLKEIEQTRNIIAHTNVLDDREIERLRLYIEDWKRQTGG